MLLVKLTPDHLRGSGTFAPVVVAEVLGLVFGDERHLTSENRDQSVRWKGLQPSFGTVRRLLDDETHVAGTLVHFVLGHRGTFELQTPAVSEAGLTRALALVGAPESLSGREAVDAIAEAAGAKGALSIADLVMYCVERGDSELTQALRDAKRDS